jgi:DnaJ-class molecular chaperone
MQYFPAAEIPNRSRSQAHGQSRPAGSDHFRALHLRETAPVELIEGAYRIIARLNHPDRGGSDEAMQEINSAYAQLRERVRA